MKPWQKRAGTHVLCILAGICAATVVGRAIYPSRTMAEQGKAAASSRTMGQDGERAGAPRAGAVDKGRAAAMGTADYRSAWEAIDRRALKPRERQEMRKRVLEQWAMVDLEAAMKAALDCPWDGDPGEGEVDGLVPAFSQAFMKNPIGAWELIQSGKLGLGAALFRWQWVNSVAKENPKLVLSYFHEFSPGLRKAALGPVLEQHAGDPEISAAIARMLAGLPADDATKGLASEYFRLSPPKEEVAELSARLAAAGTEQEKMIAFQALVASLRGSGFATIRAEWEKLPATARDELVTTLLTSPSPQAGQPPTALLDLAMQTGNWDLFKDPRISGTNGVMAEYAKRAEPIALAEWGLSLPDRPETADVFRRAMSGYIDKNYVEARDWILSIPEGDWRRERALAEYSQNALWAKKDPVGSQWAIDQIQDPTMKGTVINWRKEWTERTGRR